MYRQNTSVRGASRPPSAPPTAGTKRKERDYEQDNGDETNINVVVRCRGRTDREVHENSGVVLQTNGVKGNTIELSMGPNALSNKTYQFDKVFSQAADQAIVFDEVVSPILSEMLGGFNCTIFAYGQTGTGKTYTMSGDMTESCGLLTDAAGIIPRVFQSLFRKLEADGAECTVKCSFIELYNEELRDLLAQDESVKLKIYDDTNKKNQGATLVQGMEESHITNAAAGIKLLQKGSLRRQVAATKCNDLSSRSHTVFSITTYVKKPLENVEDYICSGKLNLVDLAGSENIQRSGAENKRAAEAGLINKSLLTLGRVINALVDKSQHIPYRESKLTRLLQDSLGGRTKTCIIATVSPAQSNLEETISTLDYAFRAKNIRNKPQVNSMISKKTLLKEFTNEIEKLKGELIATRQRNGVYMSNEQFEQMTIESESRRILSEEQKARIDTMEASLRNRVQELFSLTNNFTSLKKDNDSTRTNLENTKDVLQRTEIVLADTKNTLEAEMVSRQKYAANESKWHQVGTELLSTVQSSLRDVDGLHKKLKRRSVLHGQNKDAWESIQAQGLIVLNAMDSDLHGMQRQHGAVLESTLERVHGFVTHERERSQSAQDLVQRGMQSLDAGVESVINNSVSARDNTNEVLEEIKVLRDEVRSKVGEGLQGLNDAAAKISAEVIAELETFGSQLFTSYRDIGRQFRDLFEDLLAQLDLQRQESDRLRAALHEANQKNIQASLGTANQLESLLEQERRQAEEERRDLLDQISTLVTRQSGVREHRLGDLLNSTRAHIMSATEEFEVANKDYSAGMDKWQEVNSTSRGKITSSRDELRSRLQKDYAAVSTRNTAIQASTRAIHHESVKIVDSQMSNVTSQMAALDDFVCRARQQNNNHHQGRVESLMTLSAQVGQDLQGIVRHADSGPMRDFELNITRQLEQIGAAIAPMHERIFEPLQSLRDDLTDQVMTDYMPTGETPQKRDWQYPTTLPRAMSSSDMNTLPSPPASSNLSSNGARTPGNRSPRKMCSPKKSAKKQTIVRADTPPTVTESAPTIRREAVESLASLREMDVNTINTPAATGAATSALASEHSSTTTRMASSKELPASLTTSSRLPTKPVSRQNTYPTIAMTTVSQKAEPCRPSTPQPLEQENVLPPPNAIVATMDKPAPHTVTEMAKDPFMYSAMSATAGRVTRSSTRNSMAVPHSQTRKLIQSEHLNRSLSSVV